MKKNFICMIFIGSCIASFSQSKLNKAFFNLKTLNDSSRIYKYLYKSDDRTGYAIHKDNFVAINNTVFTSDDYSILVQGYLLKSKYKLSLKKVNDNGEDFLDVPKNEMDNFFYKIIIIQIETYLKDYSLRKKIKDDIDKGLLKYSEKRQAYEYQNSFEKYDEISVSIQNTDPFTITTRILIRGTK